MYFHGSPTRLEPGTVIVPGDTIGSDHNGAPTGHQHVYMTAVDGWSMSELHPDDRLGCIDPLDYALQDAYLWGFGADEGPYVHIVEPLGGVEYDPHTDAGPAARRTTSARVVAVLEGPREDLLDIYTDWQRSTSEAAA